MAKSRVSILLSNQWMEDIIEVLRAEIIVGDHPNNDVETRYAEPTTT